MISELIVSAKALRPDQHITRNLRLLVAEDMVPFPGKEGTRPVGTGAERRRVGCWGNAPHSECGGVDTIEPGVRADLATQGGSTFTFDWYALIARTRLLEGLRALLGRRRLGWYVG